MSFSEFDFEKLTRKDFPKVSVKRVQKSWTETCKEISDTVLLECNVRDEVVFQSFIEQNKNKSENLEQIIKRIGNIRPKCAENLPKRLQSQHKTNSKHKKGLVVNQDTSLNNLIEYFLDNMRDTTKGIKPSSLSLRHQSNVKDSDITSKAEVFLKPLRIVPTRHQVYVIPIDIPNRRQCFLVRTLSNDPTKLAPAT